MRFSGRHQAEFARRVEARGRRASPEPHRLWPRQAITHVHTLATARTQQRTPFPSPLPPSSLIADRRHATIAITGDSSPSQLLRHHSRSTITPSTHRIHPCPLIELRKLQHRAPACQSSAAVLCRRGHAATVHYLL